MNPRRGLQRLIGRGDGQEVGRSSPARGGKLAAQDEEIKAGALKSLSAEQVEKLAMLSVVSRSLNSSHEVETGLHSVLNELLTALNGDRGFVQLLTPEGEFSQVVSLDR